MNKKQLREQMKTKLKKISPVKKSEIEHKLFDQLTSSDLWKNAHTIGLTISQSFEWNTKPIIEAAWKMGKVVVIPKCYPKDKTLKFYKFKSYEQLETVYYNLLEPKPIQTKQISKDLIDLLIVPGLLFDNKGYRIGFGGGYFDRFLIDFPNKSLSLFSEMQLVNELPTEGFDIPVQHLITEQGIVK